MTIEQKLTPETPLRPFSHPEWTAKGERRASVALERLETLWFNTGTLCNIECVGCYIESSPTNDRLVYITAAEVKAYLDEIAASGLETREIAFTGGEPFMNPEMIEMIEAPLRRGFEVLVLTNAMRPMMRKTMLAGLARLIGEHGDRLTLRISLDHHTAAAHDELRGAGAFEKTLTGMRWLRDQGARMAVAGRTLWGEAEGDARRAFADLFEAEGFAIDAADPGACVLFPEMDETVETPEITTACWGILDKAPSSVMCSNSRMVVKRKGAKRPTVLACTLLPYDPAFELGETLAAASGAVSLNHPHCSKFCVLGGASCSA
ncbi:MAG: radical SAM protein [Pseudomonadota bacterium]